MSKPKCKTDKFCITICGEFFPEIYPAVRSPKWSRGNEDPVQTEMRLFCACERWAFTRLVEGASRDTVKEDGQELFGLNSRYVDDARLKAQAVLDSQREVLDSDIEDTQTKLGRARKRLGQTVKKLARAVKRGAPSDVLEKLGLTVKGRNARVASLDTKLAELKAHRENGTIPTVVFRSEERRPFRRSGKARPDGEGPERPGCLPGDEAGRAQGPPGERHDTHGGFRRQEALEEGLQGPGFGGGVAGRPQKPPLLPGGRDQGRQPEHESDVPGRGISSGGDHLPPFG